jgi:hypothetical protein
MNSVHAYVQLRTGVKLRSTTAANTQDIQTHAHTQYRKRPYNAATHTPHAHTEDADTSCSHMHILLTGHKGKQRRKTTHTTDERHTWLIPAKCSTITRQRQNNADMFRQRRVVHMHVVPNVTA